MHPDVATDIIKREFSNCEISAPVDAGDLFVFQVWSSDPDEGGWDPYYSVNKSNGELRDYSILVPEARNVVAAFEARMTEGAS